MNLKWKSVDVSDEALRVQPLDNRTHTLKPPPPRSTEVLGSAPGRVTASRLWYRSPDRTGDLKSILPRADADT